MIKNSFLRLAYPYDANYLLQSIADENEDDVKKFLAYEFINTDESLMMEAIDRAITQQSKPVMVLLIPKAVVFKNCANDLLRHIFIFKHLDLLQIFLSAKEFSFEDLWSIMQMPWITFWERGIEVLLEKTCSNNQDNYEKILAAFVNSSPSSPICNFLIHDFLNMPGVVDRFKHKAVSLFEQAIHNKNSNIALAILNHFELSSYDLGDLDILINKAIDIRSAIILDKLVVMHSGEYSQRIVSRAKDFLTILLKGDGSGLAILLKDQKFVDAANNCTDLLPQALLRDNKDIVKILVAKTELQKPPRPNV